MKNNILCAIFKDLYNSLKNETKSIIKNLNVENDGVRIYINKKNKDSIEQIPILVREITNGIKNTMPSQKIMFYCNPVPPLKLESNEKLEEELEQYLIDILGIENKSEFGNHYKEIKKYFENILKNDYDFSKTVTENIKMYKEKFIGILKSHPLTRIFINTLCTLYGNDYNFYDEYSKNKSVIDNLNLTVGHEGNSFLIQRFTKCNDESFLSIKIIDIDIFENILTNYITEIQNSDSFYNIFNNSSFENVSYGSKLKLIFFSTMLNATSNDLLNIEKYFQKYTDFIIDNTFEKIKSVTKLGNIFDDELYVKVKRSELEYETPYYLCYMLKNKHVELPNIRIGIENKLDKKVAHILATQSSQIYMDKQNESEIQKEIKKNIPKSSMYRFYNPTHLISLIITFGILKGLNIEDIDVVDYMPFRHKKTILEKNMSDEEADIYQTRLTEKNITTYMKLSSICSGIDVVSYPDMNLGLKLKISDNVKFANDFLQLLYDYGYNVGECMMKDDCKKLLK